MKEGNRRNYLKHKEKRLEYQKSFNARRRERSKQWLAEFTTPCIICGEDEPICIDFHHVDPSNKVAQVGHIARTNTREKFLAEVVKCVCLCANCHRKLHAGLIELPE